MQVQKLWLYTEICSLPFTDLFIYSIILNHLIADLFWYSERVQERKVKHKSSIESFCIHRLFRWLTPMITKNRTAVSRRLFYADKETLNHDQYYFVGPTQAH